MTIFDSTHSTKTRSLKSVTASILCGFLFSLPIANVAFADAKDVIDDILAEALPEFQSQMASMSQGCSGGSNGMPPLNWQARQAPGNQAVQSLSAARADLAKGQNDAAKQDINNGLAKWDELIRALAGSCPGGSSGQDPVNYGVYVKYRDVVKERLVTAMKFL